MNFLKVFSKVKNLFPKKKEKDTIDCGIYVGIVINERAGGKEKEIYYLYLGIGGIHPRSEVLEKAKSYFDKEGIECFTIRMATEEEKSQR